MFPTNSSSTTPSADFEQKFCARYRVAPERCREIVLRRTLYPHARLLRRLILLFAPEFFAADYDFIAGVGRLRRRRDFKIEVWDFLYNPANRGPLRRTLRLRVSVQRTQALLESLLGESARESDAVFLRDPDANPAPLA